MNNIVQYRYWEIFLITIIFSLFIEAPMTFRHYEEPPFLLYFVFAFVGGLLYIIPSSKFILAEKIIYTIPIACFGLMSSCILTSLILGSIYGFDENFDTLNSPILFQNFTFYTLTNIFVIGIFYIWNKYKKEIYN